MQAGGDGDLELGADAVGGGDQDGVLEAGGLGVEQRAEAAQRGGGAGPGRSLGQGPIALTSALPASISTPAAL